MTVTRRIQITSLLLTAVAATAMGATAGAADKPADEAARAGIQATIDNAHAILVRGGSAKEFTDAYFEDDVMASARGRTSFGGVAALLERLPAYMTGGNLARCEFKIIGSIRHSGNLATAFIQEHCAITKAGDTVYDSRLLLVFRNGSKGWRVTQELGAPGVF